MATHRATRSCTTFASVRPSFQRAPPALGGLASVCGLAYSSKRSNSPQVATGERKKSDLERGPAKERERERRRRQTGNTVVVVAVWKAYKVKPLVPPSLYSARRVFALSPVVASSRLGSEPLFHLRRSVFFRRSCAQKKAHACARGGGRGRRRGTGGEEVREESPQS